MFRYVLLLVLLSTILVSASRPAYGSDLTFFIETVVARDGAAPSLFIDDSGRPWIGYWVSENNLVGTIHFAVRDAGAWQFDTVPFNIRPPTNMVVESTGSPAVGHIGAHGTLDYLYKSGGVWTTESIGGFWPNASALAVSSTGRPFAAYVWSYHYCGYLSVSEKRSGHGWVKTYQSENTYWFNPASAAVDLAIDGCDGYHIFVNPIRDEFFYLGSGSQTFPPR